MIQIGPFFGDTDIAPGRRKGIHTYMIHIIKKLLGACDRLTDINTNQNSMEWHAMHTSCRQTIPNRRCVEWEGDEFGLSAHDNE